VPRILVVDDGQTVLDSSRLVLEGEGHEVELAACGAQALALVRSRSWDLVLSDLKLPDLSGLDLLRLIRGDANPVPFVVVTGFGSSRAAVEAIKLGASDLVEKPMFAGALVDLAYRYATRQVQIEAARWPPTQPNPAATDPQMHAAER